VAIRTAVPGRKTGADIDRHRELFAARDLPLTTRHRAEVGPPAFRPTLGSRPVGRRIRLAGGRSGRRPRRVPTRVKPRHSVPVVPHRGTTEQWPGPVPCGLATVGVLGRKDRAWNHRSRSVLKCGEPSLRPFPPLAKRSARPRRHSWAIAATTFRPCRPRHVGRFERVQWPQPSLALTGAIQPSLRAVPPSGRTFSSSPRTIFTSLVPLFEDNRASGDHFRWNCNSTSTVGHHECR